MQQWEYRTLTESGFDPQTRNCLFRLDGTLKEAHQGMSFVDVLNESGRQGWEAVAVHQDDGEVTYLLKRSLSEQSR